MLTVPEAATHCRVCESVVRGWIKSGQLPHYRLGLPGKRGKIAIKLEDLEAFLSNCKVAKKPEPQKKPLKQKTAFRHLKMK